MTISVRRLGALEYELASTVTRVMAEIFDEGNGSSSDRLSRLLQDERFWLFGAFDGERPVGGLTAHVISLTREEGCELMIYDVAVLPSHQRHGIGARLMSTVLDAAREQGLLNTFVPADNEDQHALDFYHAIGGEPQAVTIFNFDS